MSSVQSGDLSPEELKFGQNSGKGSSNLLSGNLIDAISQIQQLAVMELSRREIPEHFFTMRARLNFFSIGFGNGMIEGTLFAVLTALILPINANRELMEMIAEYFPLVRYKVFLLSLNLIPLFIAITLCSLVGKFRNKRLTTLAIDFLLIGRCFCLVIEGIIVFGVMVMLHKYLMTTENIQRMAMFFAARSDVAAETAYRIISDIRPKIIPAAYQTLYIFIAATLVPFFSVWLISSVRKAAIRKSELFWEQE